MLSRGDELAILAETSPGNTGDQAMCLPGLSRSRALQEHEKENMCFSSFWAKPPSGKPRRDEACPPPTTTTSLSRSRSRHYVLRRELGSGAYGTVHLCEDDATKREFACKTIPRAALKSDFSWKCAEREIRILSLLKGRHPAILQFKDLAYSPSSLHLITEICWGGDLLQLMQAHGRLPEPAARFMLRQLASATATCHSLGVVHRDIKPENILFDRPAVLLYSMKSPACPAPPIQPKLGDFGLSRVLPPGETSTDMVGSLQYCAPEVYHGDPYECAADMWSLGVVLYVMLSGTLPFPERPLSHPEMNSQAMQWDVVFWCEEWKGVSKEAKDLVGRMMQTDPKKRLSAEEVLLHPWMMA